MRKRAAVVMGKLPKPGRVKTRLQLPPEVAARLYRAFLQDVFATVDGALLQRPGQAVFACALEPGEGLQEAAELAPDGWSVVAQEGEELGARMRHAWRSGEAQQALVLGSDLPTLPAQRLVEAFDVLEEREAAVFVPAEDGGYMVVGMRRDLPALFRGIPWSTPSVMAATEAAAKAANIEIVRLAAHWDVDHPEDLVRLVQVVRPESHTGRALAGLEPFALPRSDP